MTTYTTIPNSQIAVGAPITNNLMTALRDNLLAAFEGDATATAAGVQLATAGIADLAVTSAKLDNDTIDGGKIASSAISQGELNSTTAASSVGVAAQGQNTLALTGGMYSWWTAGATSMGAGHTMGFGNSNTAAGTMGLSNTENSARTFFIDERYVQASPPYYLWNGSIWVPVPGYVWIYADRTTKAIEGITVADDPPWAYHGPTNIQAKYIRDGKAYRREYQYIIDGVNAEVEANASRRRRANVIARVRDERTNNIKGELEITPAIKNADMNLHPTPWPTLAASQKRVMMLDPEHPVTDEIFHGKAAGMNILKMIQSGAITLDTDAVTKSFTIPGVDFITADWS